MRVTVLPADRAVYINNTVVFFDFVVDSEIPTIHAIQWHDTYGHIEHIDEFGKMIAVESIDSIDFIQNLVEQANTIINTISIQSSSNTQNASVPTVL